MINKSNFRDIMKINRELLPRIRSRVEETRDQSSLFKFAPVEHIKAILGKKAQVLQFPSNSKNYGGMVLYRNNRFYIHINTAQPKIYENLMWVHEYYHFIYESNEIKNSKYKTFFEDSLLNERERAANLFAAELLIDTNLLSESYQMLSLLYPNENNEKIAMRLIPRFEIPYKAIIIKLAQEQLISIEKAESIIDFDYKNHLPPDFDQTLIQPTMAVKLNNLAELLGTQEVISNLRKSEYESYVNRFEKHFAHLIAMRESKERKGNFELN